MTRRPLLAALALAALVPAWAADSVYDRRERDWRNGAVVYQVIVDRFAPSANLDAKRALYPAPKRLRSWDEVPTAGVHLPEYKVNSAELDFWGGDLASTSAHLAHLKRLGADVLYLNPIHLAWTNHKYDALDYQAISPEYGTREDFKRLAAQARQLGLKVVLDGVFNHMGRNAPIFQQALADPKSPYRNWFAIGPQYAGGARVWTGFQNHPELNLEHLPVRRHLWLDRDSVLRSYLRDGADGWRLDTAYELGPRYLRELTDAAHREKPGSLVVGEIVNWPDRWLQSHDAVMGFTLRMMLFDLARGQASGGATGRRIDALVKTSGIEPTLRSWNLLDNHDLPRLHTEFPEAAPRRLLQALQFTLPGAPNLYYGIEVGMEGGPDPANRGPMRWDRVSDEHPEMRWVRQLIALRREHRALRVGDHVALDGDRLLAFLRHTDRPLDSRVVVANPTRETVKERLPVPDAWLMDGTPMVDVLNAAGGTPARFTLIAGLLEVEVPPQTAMVLQPRPEPMGGYDRYKRVP